MKTIRKDADEIAKEFNRRYDWDPCAALTLAHEVLTDANCHFEADALLKAAQKNDLYLRTE